MKIKKSHVSLVLVVLLGLIPLGYFAVSWVVHQHEMEQLTAIEKQQAMQAQAQYEQRKAELKRIQDQRKDLVKAQEKVLEKTEKVNKAMKKYEKAVIKEQRVVQTVRRQVTAVAVPPPPAVAPPPPAAGAAPKPIVSAEAPSDYSEPAAGEEPEREPVVAMAAPPPPPQEIVLMEEKIISQPIVVKPPVELVAQADDLRRREEELKQATEALAKRERELQAAKPTVAAIKPPDAPNPWIPVISGIVSIIGTIITFYLKHIEKLQAVGMALERLAAMSIRERLQLLVKSLTSMWELRRLFLRTDRIWSIYGMVHTAMIPEEGPGRPLQYISRNNTPVDAIMAQFPKILHWDTATRVMYLVVKPWMNPRAIEIGFMQSGGQVAFNYDHWTMTQFYKDPKDVVADLKDNEVAIMLYFQQANSSQVMTMISTNGYIPQTLLEWEDFILLFRQNHRLIVMEHALMDVVSIHRTI